jgi:DNA polymerase III sliding clamp (beta) subunit (PCNA family)
MKIPAQKIETAAPKNDVRYYLHGAYLNVETSELVVTDGHILVKHTVELDDGDISGIIPLEAFAYARKTKEERITTARAPTTDTHYGAEVLGVPTAYVNGASFPLIDGTYPDYTSVMPEPTEVTICLDLTLLDKIRRALFEKTGPSSKCPVTIQITDKHSGVRIESDDNVAVIMPCRM